MYFKIAIAIAIIIQININCQLKNRMSKPFITKLDKIILWLNKQINKYPELAQLQAFKRYETQLNDYKIQIKANNQTFLMCGMILNDAENIKSLAKADKERYLALKANIKRSQAEIDRMKRNLTNDDEKSNHNSN